MCSAVMHKSCKATLGCLALKAVLLLNDDGAAMEGVCVVVISVMGGVTADGAEVTR